VKGGLASSSSILIAPIRSSLRSFCSSSVALSHAQLLQLIDGLTLIRYSFLSRSWKMEAVGRRVDFVVHRVDDVP